MKNKQKVSIPIIAIHFSVDKESHILKTDKPFLASI